jgi:uncharacterized protein
VTTFNVAGLLREPPGASRSHRLRDHYVALGPEVELAGPLDGEIRLQRTNRGILVRGSVGAALRRTCARCLEPFVEEVVVDVAEEFLPSVDPSSGAALAAPADDEQVLPIDAHHDIDLTVVLHDELLLTEPLTPLCRPDCAGLCPICGLPRQGDHAHEGDDVDPRLAGLARLLERSDDRPDQ